MADMTDESFLNTIQANEIRYQAQNIVKRVNDLEIIRPGYTLGVQVLFSNVGHAYLRDKVKNVSVSFYIDKTKKISGEKAASGYDQYCSGLYENTSIKGIGLVFACKITSVYSKIGNRVGTFLTHLQILLAMKVRCIILELENMTDSPSKAATGIYKMFDYYKRGVSMRGLSLAQKLSASMGDMRLTVDGGTMKIWRKQMRKIINEIKENDPWDVNAKTKLEQYLLEENQYGGKRKTKRRKPKKRFTRNR